MSRRRRKREGPTGLLLIDKPVGPTSREVAESVCRGQGWPQAGHCGTLDPLASGLLVLVSGRATRVQDLLTGHDKVYDAVVRFGGDSVTDDAEGPITARDVSPPPGAGEVEAALARLTGEISQRPPALSAIRIDGKRAFARVREGEDVVVPERPVVVHRLDIVGYDYPELRLQVACGAGTYVRSLARDAGEMLGCGGYLTGLRRRRSGWFSVEDAVSPDDVTPESLIPLEDALEPLPRVDVPPEALEAFLGGREVNVDPTPPTDAGEALAWSSGRVVARSRMVGPGVARMKRLIVDPRDGPPLENAPPR